MCDLLGSPWESIRWRGELNSKEKGLCTNYKNGIMRTLNIIIREESRISRYPSFHSLLFLALLFLFFFSSPFFSSSLSFLSFLLSFFSYHLAGERLGCQRDMHRQTLLFSYSLFCFIVQMHLLSHFCSWCVFIFFLLSTPTRARCLCPCCRHHSSLSCGSFTPLGPTPVVLLGIGIGRHLTPPLEKREGFQGILCSIPWLFLALFFLALLFPFLLSRSFFLFFFVSSCQWAP